MAEQTVSVLRTVDDRVLPVAGVYEIDAPDAVRNAIGRLPSGPFRSRGELVAAIEEIASA